MGLAELFALAVGLSMDAFAVSVGKGLSMRRLDLGQAALIALFFGGFQALMPFLGWLFGEGFDQIVSAVEGWVAFALLAFVGGKMLWDAFHDEEDDPVGEFELDLRELLMLAVATSIDAFAAGVALSLLDADIAFAAAFIGFTTFILAFSGVCIGHRFGTRWGRPSTIIGGLILIAIGLKILIESSRAL